VSKPRCCEAEASPPRRGLKIAGTVIPAAVLVLLPKCPACIVAYLALGTGLGVTIPTAAYLRTLLLMVCVACLVYVATRQVLRRIAIRAGRSATHG
jgi:threonine/homoserine/homoserine lactone efflux protein